MKKLLEKEIAEIMTRRKLTLSLAESCTGGLVSDRITNIPGSSVFLKGSVVAYSNDIKNSALNVPERTIDKYGAVSPDVAKCMAEGVKDSMKTDISAAITGIAGPGGGTDKKPVGLAYMAVSFKNKTVVKKTLSSGSRKTVKKAFAETVLSLLKDQLFENHA